MNLLLISERLLHRGGSGLWDLMQLWSKARRSFSMALSPPNLERIKPEEREEDAYQA
jgi:hypothetical protein